MTGKYRETRQNQLITATIDRLKSTEQAQVREMEISLESLEKSSPTKSLSICVSGNLSRDILVDEFDCKTWKSIKRTSSFEFLNRFAACRHCPTLHSILSLSLSSVDIALSFERR